MIHGCLLEVKNLAEENSQSIGQVPFMFPQSIKLEEHNQNFKSALKYHLWNLSWTLAENRAAVWDLGSSAVANHLWNSGHTQGLAFHFRMGLF